MKRKATTNPQIDGKPMSFVRLGSSVAGPLKLYGEDAKGETVRLYTRDVKGTVHRVRKGE